MYLFQNNIDNSRYALNIVIAISDMFLQVVSHVKNCLKHISSFIAMPPGLDNKIESK